MKRRTKKLFAILLSLALVVGMIPAFGVTASAAEMCTVTFHNNGHGTLKVESIQIEKGKALNYYDGSFNYAKSLMGKSDGLQHSGWGKSPSAKTGSKDEYNMNLEVEADMDLYAIWSPYIDHVILSLPEESRPVAGSPIPAEPKVDLVYPVNPGSDTYYEIDYSDVDWIKDTVWLNDEGTPVMDGTFHNNEKYTLRVRAYSWVTYKEGPLPFSVDTNLDCDIKDATLNGKQADRIEGYGDSEVIMYFDFAVGEPVTKCQWFANGAEKSTGLAAKGETVTLTAVEDWFYYGVYYTFSHWEVLDGNVTLSDPTKRTVSFIMPAEEVIVEAVFDDSPIQVVDKIVMNLTTPVAGKKPASTMWCAGAEVDGLTWYRQVTTERGILDWEEMPASATFQEGKKYLAKIELVPSLGYVFPELSDMNIKLNNQGLAGGVTSLTENEMVIQKEFTATAAQKNPFVDVSESDYFYEPVLWAVDKGITNGTDATHFSPAATCTRGQVVTFLWRAAGSPTPTSTTNPFTDVAPSDYYYNAVLWAVGKNITNGTSATTFGPNDGCTRGQVVTFLHRFENSPKPSSSTNPFVDVSNSEYYYTPVLWAVGKGITNGTDATHFSPNATCTRGQIVTFLYRDMK